MQSKLLRLILIPIGLAALILPALFYIRKWGFGFWSNHSDWSIMAAYFNGFYGPILTAISIFFVATQIRNSSTDNRKSELNAKFEMLSRNLIEQLKELNASEINVINKEVQHSITIGNDPILGDLAYDFYKSKSRLMHTVIGVGRVLNSIKNLDEEQFLTLRTILFSNVERDTFSKLEYIAQKFNLIKHNCICESNNRS
jgi:uncharacterized membrane protein